MIKYTLNKNGAILKDGHTMFPFDIVSDLNRKAFLEQERENNKKLNTGACEHKTRLFEIINRLRVLVNHLPFMNAENQNFMIGKANLMLDEHFAGNGKFLETDLTDWQPPNKKLKMDATLCDGRICDFFINGDCTFGGFCFQPHHLT